MKFLNRCKHYLLILKEKKNQFFILMMSLLPDYAFAADRDAIVTIVYNVCNYLSNVVAVALGILAIIWLGFEMMSGHMERKKAISIGIGIGIAIGASYLGKHVVLGDLI